MGEHDMDKLQGHLNTPARLVTAMALLILLGEFLIMLLIEGLQGTILNDVVLEKKLFEFMDPIILIIFVSPALFLLILKPMRAQQAALEKREREYRRFVENLQEGIWMVDQDAGTSFVNLRMAQMLGYSVEEMQRTSFVSFMDAHGRTIATQNLQRGKLGNTERHDIELLRKDGARIYTSMTTSPILDEAGNYAGTLAGVTDISERKRAEAALRDSETRYRSLISALAEGVVLRDMNGRIVDCNASAERILGRTLDQMRGNLYFDSTWQAIREDGSPLPQDQRPIHVALRTRRLQSSVVLGLRKPDGAVLWLSMNVQPLFDESGTTLTGLVSTLTDVTASKHAQQRSAMEHAVTRVLAEAETVADAIPRIVQTICENLGWACGAHWRWDEKAELLRCAETWHIDAAEVTEFIATASASVNEAPARRGEAAGSKTGGLVRRVWIDGAPVWFPDVAREQGFRRGPIAAKAGLHSAFGFPITDGAQGLGVMEFYGRNIEQPNEVLLQAVRAIGSQIGHFVARRQAEELIRHLAKYDELTGLPNRSLFHDRLHHAFAQVQRHDKRLAILFIDLDRFKHINDTLGHEAGDQVLRDVAERLLGCLRRSDTVGRLGGDEFVVLIEELPRLASAVTLAQKILDAVARPFILAAQELHIGASIGISIYPEHGRDPQSLLNHADAAMYRAKEQGRNNYQIYAAQMTPLATGFSEALALAASESKTNE
jgi:diguanylate cyclase (GGDEF)-like protein/PAS domain S-box-containing protein